MAQVIWAVVKDGAIVPNQRLPEGAHVEIHIHRTQDVSPELQAEFDAYRLASAKSLELVERLAHESESE
jgi:hypothetical protein